MQSNYLFLSQSLETLQAKQETFFFKEALELYIPPQVGRYVGDDKPQDAAEAIHVWLKNPDKSCLLLLGDSGAGKTLFGQWLTRHSFQNQLLHGRIPLFIPLLAQHSPDKNLIDDYLKITCGIEDKIQRDFIKQQPLLLILDGFDEIHQKINLHRSNQLWQLKNVKIIISCRSQALANTYNYAQLFYPYNAEDKPQPYQLEEYVVNPFTEKQIDAYLQQYVSTHQEDIKISHPDWLQWQAYQVAIQNLRDLKLLLTSPFVLSIAVKVLPSIIAKHKNKESIEQRYLAKINLYDHFAEQWFARQRQKIIIAQHISVDFPIEDLFAKCSKAIANAMLQAKVNSVELTSHKIVPLLGKQSFFSEDRSSDQIYDMKTQLKYFDEGIDVIGEKIKLSLILSGCPMMQIQKNHYAFLHKSLLEYFASRKLFEGVMVDASIALGYELNESLLVDEPGTLKFLAERVKEDDALKERLFAVIEESKTDERVEVAASNAITILNYAGVSFAQNDFHYIRIKGADLSNAILDSTDLREADLRRVKLNGAWLNHAKCGGVLMEGVGFGEFPYLEGTNPIMCIAYSSDGNYLASGSDKGNIRLWEVNSGHWIATLKGHTKSIRSLSFSPDGNCLVSTGSEDDTLHLWDVKNQKTLGVLKRDTRYKFSIESVALSPDGKMLAAGSWDKFVCLWDVKSQACLGVLEDHTGPVTSVTFSPDGTLLASGSVDRSVCLWDVKSQNCLGVLKGHTNHVNSIAFSPDGTLLASGSGGVGSTDKSDQSVRLWDVKSQACLGVLEKHTGPVTSVAFSPDGTLLASGSVDCSVRLWNPKTQAALGVLKGHTSDVTSIAFSPDGRLASGSKDKSVRFWNPNPSMNLDFLERHTNHVNSVAFSPGGTLLASGSVDRSVRLWDVKSQTCLRVLEEHTNVTSVTFSPDGKLLASGSDDSSVRLWEVKSQTCLGVLKGYEGVQSVAFSPDGKMLASVGAPWDLRLWDVKSKTCLGILEGHEAVIYSVAFSPDGSCLASGSYDKSVRLWDVKSQTCLGVLKGYEGVQSVAFSPDGKLLASGSVDRSVRLWDVRNQTCLGILKGHTNYVNSIAFNPNGHYLASGSEDKSVRLWHTLTLQCLHIAQFNYSIRALAFKKEVDKTYLCVASDHCIDYFEIKTIQSKYSFVLIGSMGGRDTGLQCEEMDIGGAVITLNDKGHAVGMNATNTRLLQQRSALGNPSQKKTKDVLEARRHTIPYNPKQPPYNLFSHQHFVTPDHAMVSFVRKKANKGSEHAFLVIEYINESNYYTITRADFFLDQKQKHSQGMIFSSGQALVEICTKPLSEMQILAPQCVYKCWKITEDQTYVLLANLEADRLKHITYLNVGNSPLYSVIQPGVTKHNCLTWCEGHLTKVGVDVSEQQSWLDVIVAHPEYHLPNNDSEATNGEKCLVM